ncbi:MAG TPA: MoaD/ThiS family protein, partial [Tepidisphaeraceae bacterium]|nr:MoaD/ThiS family protein [Tepidisphaeraceae bacterium]
MKIKVRFFAILRERAGVGEIVLQCADGSQIGQVVQEIQRRFPEIEKYVRRAVYAVNQEYVT